MRCFEYTMLLAIVEHNGENLHIQRLNKPYFADIKSGLNLGVLTLIFFGGVDIAVSALNMFIRQTGGRPLSAFMSLNQLLLMTVLVSVAILINLIPDFVGLLSPQIFDFDRSQNVFSVGGAKVSNLNRVALRMQDGFGPSRRAFRIVVTVSGKDYIIAQTQRITTATLSGKEYPSVATSEGLQRQYWFRRWADYAGAKTGFDPVWPEYREIFVLYTSIKEYVETGKRENFPL